MFKLFLTMLRELFLSKVVESFWSKVVEKTADNAVNSALNIKDFELILKFLEENLKLLSIKACDVEKEVKNAELSGRKKRKREVEEWLEQVKSIEKEVGGLRSGVDSQGLFWMSLMAGGEAAELNEQVENLIEQSRNFGQFMLLQCRTRGEPLLTHGMIGEEFNKNSEMIMKLLETKEVSRIGVHGMGGVGKKTLAKHIHNQLLQQSEGCVIWVTVSQEFTIKRLQDEIARFMGAGLLDDEDDEERRAAILRKALSQHKHSALILDDVCEEIDMIKLGVSDKCCRLIITSRSLEVCSRISCQKVISVKELCEDEAWRLFSEKLGNVMELAPQVVEKAKSMAKLCSGLPLAIITTAGTMMGVTSIHTWNDECLVLKDRFVGQDDMGDIEKKVYKVLRYSFDRLNRNHQSHSHEFNTYQLCFMYFSLYPEDYLIRRGKLVKKFISEGLLDERKRRREQVDLGHRILDKLVNVSLLESCDDGPDKCVKMHDLVRGMALKIDEVKYMVAPDEVKLTKGLEKVSLLLNDKMTIVDGISPDCPKLSTLILF